MSPALYHVASVTGQFTPNQGLPMKYSPLLPQVALVFAVAYACTDSTAPANSHSLLSPTDPVLAAKVGDPPPPPVDVAMTITVSSPGRALFTGVYFSNGSTESIFNGTAWLRLNNKQPTSLGATSANARFKRQDEKLSGMGTIFFGDVAYKITIVDEFIAFEDCGFPGQTCAIIRFRATDDNGVEHPGQLTARNIEGCEFVPPPVEGSGIGFFDCGE